MEQTTPPPEVAFATDRLTVAPLVRTGDRIAATARIVTRAVTEHLPPRLHVDGAVDAGAWLDLLCEGGAVCSVEQGSDMVGFLTLHWEGPRHLMIGYLLGETVWGRGLASELVCGLVRHLDDIGWHGRVTGGVDIDNPASAAVLRKAGFAPDAGGPEGTAFYSLVIAPPRASL